MLLGSKVINAIFKIILQRRYSPPLNSFRDLFFEKNSNFSYFKIAHLDFQSNLKQKYSQ